MEVLNWVKQGCSAIKDDAICVNQTLCRGFILQSQQVFWNLPALLKVREIGIFPSVKSELILLFLCIGYHCSTSSTSFFSRAYFLLLGININEPFGFAESLPLHFPRVACEVEDRKERPSKWVVFPLCGEAHTLLSKSLYYWDKDKKFIAITPLPFLAFIF